MDSLLDLLARVEAELARGATRIELAVLDPDVARGRYAGEQVTIDGATYVHRPWRVWLELAERLGLRMLTPRPLAPPLLQVVLERLDPAARLHTRDGYGPGSPFARVSKLEDPGFVLDLTEAVARAALPPAARVLALGVHTGDELVLLRARCPALHDARMVGVDRNADALAVARARLPDATFHVADLHELAALGLERFDLVVSIATLQSPGIDDREVLRRIVQHHLAPDGAVILGVPNCRYVDGEVEYGARMVNYRQPELGLLVKDVAFYRKYLQQHGRRVFVTGKHYVLVTGVVGRAGDD